MIKSYVNLLSIILSVLTNAFSFVPHEYAAFGSAEHTGTTQNTLGFTGHEQDQESGLWYAKARYYDSELGRFISRDAFEGHGNLPASWQAYQYAYNNPMVWIDPSGHFPVLSELASWLDSRGDSVRQQIAAFDNSSESTCNMLAPKMLEVGAGLFVLDSMTFAAQTANQAANGLTIFGTSLWNTATGQEVHFQQIGSEFNQLLDGIQDTSNAVSSYATDSAYRGQVNEVIGNAFTKTSQDIRDNKPSAIAAASAMVFDSVLGTKRVSFMADLDAIAKTVKESDKLGIDLKAMNNSILEPVHGATVEIPRGFQNADQCIACLTDLKRALDESGFPNAQVGISGSSITGQSYRPPNYRFDQNPSGEMSDIDAFFISDQVKGRVPAADWVKDYASLRTWSENWTRILGREITPMGFNKVRERPSLLLNDQK